MSWHVHFRSIVERGECFHVALSKSEPYSNTLGRSAKGTYTPWVLGIAWSSDPDSPAPYAMRFAYDYIVRYGQRPPHLRVDPFTTLYLNPPTPGRARTDADLSTLPRVGIVTGDAVGAAVSQFLLPAHAEKARALCFFFARGAWLTDKGSRRGNAKAVPVALMFQYQAKVMLSVPVALEPHGRLWAAFDLVQLRQSLEHILRGEPVQPPAEEAEPVSLGDWPLHPWGDGGDTMDYFDLELVYV